MGVEYWSPLLEFLRESLLMKAAIDRQDLDQMLVTDSPSEAVSFIQRCVTERFGLRYVRRRPPKLLFEQGV
jgi:predicted Rossmann-fold nucleotide-binding protein